MSCFAAGCSEGTYNPTIGAGGTSSNAGGSAGATASAGSSGTAGSGTSGAGGAGTGAAGSSGSSSAATQLYGFQSSLEGFAINYYCKGPAANENCTTPQAQQPVGGDPGADAGDVADATPPAEPPAAGDDFFALEQDAALGEANPGSAKLTLQFTTGTQSANFAINYGSGTTAGVSLTGKTVRAQVRVEAGAPPTTYAKMYIKTGSTYYYADSGQVTLVANSWVPVSFSAAGTPAYPTPPDPAQYTLGDVREIGLEIAATGIAAAGPAVIHIDSISY